MSRYIRFWDAILAPFGREAWRNRNRFLGIQIVRQSPNLSSEGTSNG